MILVFGSPHDPQPRLFRDVCRRREVEVEVIVPTDLSSSGWRLRCGQPFQTRARVGERLLDGAMIGGVVNVLPWIGVHDLPNIDIEDRDYVANEMGAFLLAWLETLDCPMYDRPTSMSLAGCGRWPEQWAEVSRTVGVDHDLDWAGDRVEVTVLDGEALTGCAGDSALAHAASAIAEEARRSLVTLSFARPKPRPTLTGAADRPAVGSRAVADALLRRLPRN